MRTRWPNWAVKMNEAYMNMCAYEILKVVDDAHVAMVAKRQKMIKAFLKKNPVIWEWKRFLVFLRNNFIGLSSKVSTDSYKEIPRML